MNEYAITNMLINLGSIYEVTKNGLAFITERYPQLILEEIERTGKKYDMKKLEDLILKSYQYRKYPSLAEILLFLPKAEIVENTVKPIKDEGSTVRVTYISGKYQDFIVTDFGKSVDELVKRCKLRADKVRRIVLYPVGYTLLWENVYWCDDSTEAAPVQVLYGERS